MAIRSMTFDPNAEPNQTNNEIIGQINAATVPITRKDALDQNSLDIIRTNPAAGEFFVKNIQRTADGKLDVEYDNVPKV